MTKEIETYDQHVHEGILLNANELSMNLPYSILTEIQKEIMKIDFNRYPDDDYAPLFDAYAKWMHIKPEQLIAGNGSDQMLGMVIGTVLSKGKTLYTLSPDFSMYDYYASSYEAKVEKYPTHVDGSFDIQDFIEKGKEKKADLILFSNPNNPTGHCLTEEEVLQIVKAFDGPVVIDEAYMEFSTHTMIPYVEKYPNLFVTRTLSKAYGLAGLRVGFLIGNEKAMAEYRKIRVPYLLSTVSQRIATIVIEHAEDFQMEIQSIIQYREEMFDKLCMLRYMTFYPSEANFLYGQCEDKPLLMECFKKANIVIRDYAGGDFFRITIGNREENEKVLQVLQMYARERMKHA